jgi:hypothetical protein
MLHKFNWKITRMIYSPIKDDMRWRIRYNAGIYDVHIEMKVTAFIKFRTMQRARHVIRL